MAEKWIQKAIKRPGALSAAAKKAGAVTAGGTIKKEWLQSQASSGNDRRAAQARLAMNLAKMRRGR
jgi:hypothetical protein